MATSRKPSTKKKVQAMLAKLEKVQARNGKRGVKKHYDHKALLECVAIAESLGKVSADRDACRIAKAPSVQRNEVCAKATNYRADNAVRALIISLQKSGVISKDIWYVWSVSHAYAVRNPFTEESEKVFIIKR